MWRRPLQPALISVPLRVDTKLMRNQFLTVPTLQLTLAVNIWVSVFTFGAFSHAASPNATNSLSLAHSYPVEKLSDILLPRDQWRPFPALQERERWQALPKSVATYLVALGNEALNKPFPPLPATLYLGYARTGNRSSFESAYFERRALLQNLVLAACVDAMYLKHLLCHIQSHCRNLHR